MSERKRPVFKYGSCVVFGVFKADFTRRWMNRTFSRSPKRRNPLWLLRPLPVPLPSFVALDCLPVPASEQNEREDAPGAFEDRSSGKSSGTYPAFPRPAAAWLRLRTDRRQPLAVFRTFPEPKTCPLSVTKSLTLSKFLIRNQSVIKYIL